MTPREPLDVFRLSSLFHDYLPCIWLQQLPNNPLTIIGLLSLGCFLLFIAELKLQRRFKVEDPQNAIMRGQFYSSSWDAGGP